MKFAIYGGVFLGGLIAGLVVQHKFRTLDSAAQKAAIAGVK